MKTYFKYIAYSLIILFLITTTSFAENAKTVIINATNVESNGVPLEGKKRVLLTFFSDNAIQGGWSEDHKDIIFSNGNALIKAGTQVDITPALLQLDKPNIRLKIDGHENIFKFDLTAAPFALDMPTLRDGSQDVTLNSLAITPTSNRPFVHKDDFTNGSLSVTLNSLDIVPSANAPYFIIEDLKNQFKDNVEMQAKYGNTAPIDASWLKNLTKAQGGGLDDDGVRKEIQNMIKQSQLVGESKGLTISGFNPGTADNNFDEGNRLKKATGGLNKFVLSFDVDDPNITLDGAVDGTAQLINLQNLTINTSYKATVPVTKGGTGATDAGNARTNLSAQTQDNDLDTIAGLTPADNDFIIRTGGNWANRTLSQTKSLLNINTNSTLQVNVLQATAFQPISDQRIKKDIVSINNPLSIIKKLKGRYFYFKQTEPYTFPTKKQAGFIAQELEKILPFLVSNDSFTIGNKAFKSINSMQITAILVEAMKEQQTQIEKQQQQIEDLQKVVNQLIKDNK